MKSLGLMKSLALLGLALLALTPRSVQAQASNPNCWTATDANGNPIRQQYNGDWLLTGPIAITTSPTGVYQQMFNDGVGQYPFDFFVNPPSSTLAENLIADISANEGGGDPSSPFSGLFYNGAFISGGINITADSTPSATLTYTPPPGNTSPLPDHVDLLLTTTLTLNAFQDYDNLYGIFEDELYEQLAPVGGFPLDFVFPPHILPMPSLESSVTATDSLGDNFSVSASSEAGTGATDITRFDFIENPPIVSRHLVRVPVVNGVGTASVTEHISETANNDSSALHDPWNTTYGQSTAQAQAGISTALNFDNREVTISCPTIEPSNHKGSALTDNGTPQPVANVRNSDGSINGDSVVSVYPTGEIYSCPLGPLGVAFTANAANFSTPVYTWNLTSSSGTVLPVTQHFLDTPSTLWSSIPVVVDYGPAVQAVQVGTVSGLPAGTQIYNNPKPGSTTMTVNVTDTDGAVGTNTYTVNWHLPLENVQLLSHSGPSFNPLGMPGQPASVVTTGTALTVPAPDPGEVDWNGYHVAGGCLAAAGAGFPLLVEAGLDITNPEMLVAQGFLATASYALGLAPDGTPTPTTPVNISTTYADFSRCVTEQATGNFDNPYDPDSFSPVGYAAAIMAQLQASPSDGASDYYYSNGLLTVTYDVWDKQTVSSEVGDYYTQNGYSGQVYGTVKVTGPPFETLHWKYSGTLQSNPH